MKKSHKKWETSIKIWQTGEKVTNYSHKKWQTSVKYLHNRTKTSAFEESD